MILDLRSSSERRPAVVVAHRGASAEYPENTAAAFDAALRAPIQGIELDLQLSRDGVPVVYHDRTLRKLGAGRRSVAGTDFADLGRLDAGAWFDARFRGERLLTLEGLLERYARRTCLLLEIKARETTGSAHNRRLTEATIEALEARGLEESVLLLCFDPALLELARDLAPSLKTVQNFRAVPRDDARTWAKLDALYALSIDVRALSPGIVRRAHERGKGVLTYTCNTPRAVRVAVDAGADCIMSDRPAWLAALLKP